MEKKLIDSQANAADSKGVCEKIYNIAVAAANPAFRSIHHHYRSKSGQRGRSLSPNDDQAAAAAAGGVHELQTRSVELVEKAAAKTNIVPDSTRFLSKKPAVLAGGPAGGEVHLIPIDQLGPRPSITFKAAKPSPVLPSLQRQSSSTTPVYIHDDHHGQNLISKVASKKEACRSGAAAAVSPRSRSPSLMLEAEKLQQQQDMKSKYSTGNDILIQGTTTSAAPPPIVEVAARPSHPSLVDRAAAVTKSSTKKSTKKGDGDHHHETTHDQQAGKKVAEDMSSSSVSSVVGDKFSDYITRVRNKMIVRTPSSVCVTDQERGVNTSPTFGMSKRDSFNDKVVNYISRARKSMIRTTSTPSNLGHHHPA